MGTKMAVAFANIFMSRVETEIMSQSTIKPLVWKRYIDDLFSLWNTNRGEITQLIEQANKHRPTTLQFQFNGKNYLQTHGSAMGTKMAVAFANIFMSRVETEIMSQSTIKPLVWKRYIDDVFSLWNTNRGEITQFIEQANKHHPTIKFTAEVSDTEITFLDTIIYKGVFFETKSVLDVRTHFKPTETFQYTHFSSCHPPGVKRGFVKEEALRPLRTNSSKTLYLKRKLKPLKRTLRREVTQKGL